MRSIIASGSRAVASAALSAAAGSARPSVNTSAATSASTRMVRATLPLDATGRRGLARCDRDRQRARRALGGDRTDAVLAGRQGQVDEGCLALVFSVDEDRRVHRGGVDRDETGRAGGGRRLVVIAIAILLLVVWGLGGG